MFFNLVDTDLLLFFHDRKKHFWTFFNLKFLFQISNFRDESFTQLWVKTDL